MRSLFLLSLNTLINFNLTRYNIYPTVGSHSRPYNIVIQRMQIIGGEMTSWDTSPKKRPHDSSQSGPSKRPFSGPGPSGLQSSGGDQMIA